LIGFVVSGIANIVVDSVTISLDATPIADVLLPDLPLFGSTEVRYLESISVPLNNTGPHDLSFLKESVGAASIVALGESTHGTSEFFTLRNRVIEYLVDSMKFGIVAFESSFPHTYLANSAMKSLTAQKILDSLFGRIHQTREMAALLDWIKEKKDKGNDLVMAGFDNQWYYGVIQHLKNTFADTDRQLYSGMEQIEKHRNTYRYSAGKFDTLNQMTNQLHGDFLKRKHELLKKFRSPGEMELLEKYISLLSNGFLFEHLRATSYKEKRPPPALKNFRDSSMAENIAWIKKFYGDKKIIVIAHNGHIKKDDCNADASCSMGSFLKKQWNNLFVSCVFLTGQGNATGYSRYGEGYVYSLKPPRPDCYEYYLGQVSHPAFFLRMDNTPLPPQVNISVLTDLRWRSLGYGSSGPNEFFPINLKNACDAVFFIRNTTNSQSFHLKK
jgi:erythromycin esterase